MRYRLNQAKPPFVISPPLRGVQRAHGLRLRPARQPGAAGRGLVLRHSSGGGRETLVSALPRHLAWPVSAALTFTYRRQVGILGA
jgi:hypothetical protein